MADQDHPLELQRLDYPLDVAGQPLDAPGLPMLSRLAVPGQIDGDDAVVGRELADLVLPLFAVAAPAMEKDESRIASSRHLADDVQSVGGTDDLLDRPGVLPTGERGHGDPQEDASGQPRLHGQLRGSVDGSPNDPPEESMEATWPRRGTMGLIPDPPRPPRSHKATTTILDLDLVEFKRVPCLRRCRWGRRRVPGVPSAKTPESPPPSAPVGHFPEQNVIKNRPRHDGYRCVFRCFTPSRRHR
jgi:hypothetical protein